MRWMSFHHTQDQLRNRTKDVTRRLGWQFAKPGMRVLAVSKSQGRKKGEKPEIFGTIEFARVDRRPLHPITEEEVEREGFPDLHPVQFIWMFCKISGCTPLTTLTRIEFVFVDD